MKHTLIFIFSIIAICAYSQQKSVLFIGNSYTEGNNLPILVRDLATANGKDLYVLSHNPGGAPFDSHANNPTVHNLIKSRNWDYVILQGQSQEVAFPDNQVDYMTLPPAVRLADSVYANNFCSEVMMYMTWGRKNGDDQWGPMSTYQGMQNRLYNGYMRIADSAQASVAPVGKIWELIRASRPEVELYQADESHPTLAGSFLAAMTIYSSIYLEKPTVLVGNSGLSSTFTNQINTHIQEEILDQLDLYHLRSRSNHTVLEDVSISQYSDIVQLSATARKAQSVYWYFGDGAEAQGWNVRHQYSDLGSFTITAVAQSECNNDSDEISVVVDVLDIPEIDGIQYKIINKQLEVGDQKKGQIYGVNGQLLNEFSSALDLSFFQTGVYILVVDQKVVRFHLP